MTAQVVKPEQGKTTDNKTGQKGRQQTEQQTVEERAREEIERIRQEHDQAVRGEYESLMEIAWQYQHAASGATLAARRAKGMTDSDRRDLIDNAVRGVDSARRYLFMASDRIAPDYTYTEEPPF
jgi:hypothetical protein